MGDASAARRAALEILRSVRAGRPFDEARDRSLAALAGPDRRLAHEMAAGVLRTRRRLDGRLAPLVSARWDRTSDDLRDILRIGLYQLSELERVPPYAAVSATVDLARASGGAKAAGFVNAVLRKAAEGRTEGRADARPTDLAAHHSHPDWLVARWLARYGRDGTVALLEHNNRRPRLVLQPARWDLDRLRAALAASRVPHADAPFGAGLSVEGGRVAALPGFREGGFVVQDPVQARLLAFAAFPDGCRVWDACAAPGGKTVALAARTRVLASDRTRARVRRLAATVARAAPRAVPMFVADARRPPFRAATLDAVLLDAPCSATGTMARHPDARWRLTPRSLVVLARRQRALLDGVAALVRPGGLLVYATCSLEPEENAGQVDAFLAAHREYVREADDLAILPTEAGTDGGYAARLRRTA